jgi:hypothetical protein
MANTSRINGFRPVKYKSGAPYTGAATKYLIPATDGTAVYIGDLVKLAGSADAKGYYATVGLAAANDSVLGPVVAVEANMDNLNITGLYRAASTARYVYVADDPDLLFEAEVSNGTPAVTDVGLNVDFAVGTPSALTATSGMYIDFGTEATTSTLPLKIHGFAPREDNEVGASAKLLVSINKHQRAPGGQDDGGTADGVVGV